ncbi:MAG: hypothetical protein RLZZ200_2176, partial [Pseudomonadota bacterium]
MRSQYGISGFSAFVPPYRVQLERWCEWSGNSWPKTRAVVGNSFRVVGSNHNVYTMAANAVLKLIESHQVDPSTIGYLALGTESGTDNATSGAIIVRGLVNEVLRARSTSLLPRDMEVPEIKQACLGGIYGMKGALRYLHVDGKNRKAIVVAADIAEYARGSSGEPTQGAGAVAMLLEENPAILAIDLKRAGNATQYRALDFRKPFLRYCGQTPSGDQRVRDVPVFNGKYSTSCYSDETLGSLEAFFRKQDGGRAEYFRNLSAVFMHRPYRRMPVAAWSLAYLFALGMDGGKEHDELSRYAAAAGVDFQALVQEMTSDPRLLERALQGDLVEDPYPLATRTLKVFRESEECKNHIDARMTLGSVPLSEMGNLYTAALPAWLAAGLEEAANRNVDMGGREILLVAYGSGDASEALPGTVVPGWEAAAARSDLAGVLSGAVDLDREQYEALHDGREASGLQVSGPTGYVIDRVGKLDADPLQDFGI